MNLSEITPRSKSNNTENSQNNFKAYFEVQARRMTKYRVKKPSRSTPCSQTAPRKMKPELQRNADGLESGSRFMLLSAKLTTRSKPKLAIVASLQNLNSETFFWLCKEIFPNGDEFKLGKLAASPYLNQDMLRVFRQLNPEMNCDVFCNSCESLKAKDVLTLGRLAALPDLDLNMLLVVRRLYPEMYFDRFCDFCEVFPKGDVIKLGELAASSRLNLDMLRVFRQITPELNCDNFREYFKNLKKKEVLALDRLAALPDLDLNMLLVVRRLYPEMCLDRFCDFCEIFPKEDVLTLGKLAASPKTDPNVLFLARHLNPNLKFDYVLSICKNDQDVCDYLRSQITNLPMEDLIQIGARLRRYPEVDLALLFSLRNIFKKESIKNLFDSTLLINKDHMELVHALHSENEHLTLRQIAEEIVRVKDLDTLAAFRKRFPKEKIGEIMKALALLNKGDKERLNLEKIKKIWTHINNVNRETFSGEPVRFSEVVWATLPDSITVEKIIIFEKMLPRLSFQNVVLAASKQHVDIKNLQNNGHPSIPT
ncbi:hypothetical protein FIV00_04020 [Labrenzia sp. THAF82]|uniref:hypothetical protein n=1 Tax=Labrenzia sp. THAF82 TaxID=2587861 RepID=UPI00126930D6|nr:hypothetical protein [Labrenzia sp. THAF82]QFT29635.1 hypothetical protein FIV00_04020 [Labrenzia sp. THAF82]